MTSSICIALSLAFSVAVSAQSSWPTHQANIRHDGYVPVQISPTKLVTLWATQIASNPLNPVAVGGSRIFATSYRSKLRAVDAATGVATWFHDYGTTSHISGPAYSNGRVYVITRDNWGYTTAFDAASGTEAFALQHHHQGAATTAPTIDGGVIFAQAGTSSGGNGIRGIDATTGKPLWSSTFFNGPGFSPTVDGTSIYAYQGGRITELDRATGVQRRVLTDSRPITSSRFDIQLVLGGNSDLIMIRAGALVRIDLKSWTIDYEINGGFDGTPAVRQGVIYALANGKLEARKQSDGQLLWTGQSNVRGEVVVTDSHVIVRNYSETFLVDLTTHQTVWSIRAGGPVSIAHNSLYIAGYDGVLTRVAFEDSPQPTSVVPDRVHFTSTPGVVTVHGHNFSGANAKLWFGDKEAAAVQIVNATTVRCVPPAHGPGPVDVEFENASGRFRLAEGFVYTPSETIHGNWWPGGKIVLTWECLPGDQIIAFVGAWISQPQIIAPFTGAYELQLPLLMMTVPTVVGTSFTWTQPIPRWPSLIGAELAFQALVGPSPMQGVATFTNTKTIRIQ